MNIPIRTVPAINNRQKHPADRSRARTRDGAPVLFALDDDPSTLGLLCDIAEDLGWIAHGFVRLHDLREHLADEAPPALVILDDDLPDGSGGDLARDLRSEPGMEDVPLLVCTAAHPMRQAEIGAWAPVVSKPFDLDEIEPFLDAAAHRRGDRSHRTAG